MPKLSYRMRCFGTVHGRDNGREVDAQTELLSDVLESEEQNRFAGRSSLEADRGVLGGCLENESLLIGTLASTTLSLAWATGGVFSSWHVLVMALISIQTALSVDCSTVVRWESSSSQASGMRAVCDRLGPWNFSEAAVYFHCA